VKGAARRLASLTLAAASRLLPAHMSSWARAMRCELAAIADDRAALLFALGCLRAAFALAIAARLEAARGPTSPPAHPTREHQIMNGISARPRLLGLICGAGAVGLGMAYMVAAGAPSRHLLVNLAALALGASAWLALGRLAGSRLAGAGPAVLALAAPLLLTALFGVAVDGASRWVSVGPLTLQVSLIVIPVILVLYARRPDAIGTAGVIVAAAALAAQPDRAMAGVLLAGLLAVAAETRNRVTMTAAAAAALAFGWTLLTPERLAAVPYVDRVLYAAFDVHALAGLAVVIGALALVLPAFAGMVRGASERAAVLAFGGCWLAVVVAAALGNYPTPLVGYGGSAVLGYLLSVALLSNDARATSRGGASETGPADDRSAARTDLDLRVAGLA
jgi:cell division protein FtsW (lipid II flippase)